MDCERNSDEPFIENCSSESVSTPEIVAAVIDEHLDVVGAKGTAISATASESQNKSESHPDPDDPPQDSGHQTLHQQPDCRGYEILQVAVVSLKLRACIQPICERPAREPSTASSNSTGSAISPLYAVLGVEATATAKEIKDAYYRVAKQWHPDKTTHPDAQDRFKAISEAYHILSDPGRRRAYDAAFAAAAAGEPPPSVMEMSSEAVVAFLGTLFGAGEFDDVFGDPTTLPALRQVLNSVVNDAPKDEATLTAVAEAMRQEEAQLCERLGWKLLRILEKRTSGQLNAVEFGGWARRWTTGLMDAPGGMDLVQTVALAYRHKARKFAQRMYGVDLLLTEGKDVVARVWDNVSLLYGIVGLASQAMRVAQKEKELEEQDKAGAGKGLKNAQARDLAKQLEAEKIVVAQNGLDIVWRIGLNMIQRRVRDTVNIMMQNEAARTAPAKRRERELELSEALLELGEQMKDTLREAGGLRQPKVPFDFRTKMAEEFRG